MGKNNKNRSARDKQRARQQAAREARREPMYPLYDLHPPFGTYEMWTTVSEAAMERVGYPPHATDEESRRVWDIVIKLARAYRMNVPTAAVMLESQIQGGFLYFAIDGDPEHFRRTPLAEVAPDNSAPDMVQSASEALHELHRGGWLLVDDNGLVHRSVPPLRPGGHWTLNDIDV
ncbi:hypothetical protein [Streptomyces antibioticus]|uniref:hypothetical protein n=1 Tax=Streptomyces antibioticus TaxID=1890 RepID=UPI003D72C97B